MNKPHSITFAVGSLLLVHGAGASAQASQPPVAGAGNTPTAAVSGFESGGVPVGATYAPRALRVADGINVTPTLGVSFGRNDNVDLARDAAARSSNVFTLTPSLLAEAAFRANRYSLGYRGEVIRFQSSSRNNVENHELGATALTVFDGRTSLTTRLAFQDRFDPVGSTDRSTATGRPDHWRGLSGAVLGTYGAEGARGRVEVELGAFDKKYLNNRATTVDADYSSTNLALRLGLRVAPKTRALIEYRYTGFDYDRNVQNLDGKEQRYLVGAEWDATALTSGSFKIGYLDKRFDRVRTGFTGLTWEGSVRWAPRTYSVVDLSTGRSASDPTGSTASFVKNAFVSANWTHQWRSSLSTRLSYSRTDSDFVGTNRADEIDTLGFAVNYDFRRSLRLGASVEHSRRSSSDAAFLYRRNLVSVFAEFAF